MPNIPNTNTPGLVLASVGTGQNDSVWEEPPSSGYASLTGPGETATPGALTQEGGFFVSDTATEGIALSSNGIVSVTSTASALALVGDAEAYIQSSGHVNVLSGSADIILTAASDDISVNATTLELNATAIGFFGHAAVGMPGIFGALSAVTDTNAKTVLIYLVNALAGMGLVGNDTT